MPADAAETAPAPAREVLAFWFAGENASRWFAADPAFDAAIRARFAATHAAAARGELDGWCATPEGWLALLIVLDQFSRNLYRGDARAFACDARAQALAVAGLARGDDGRLPRPWRAFAYLPLEHAEDPELQRQSVARFRALAEQAPSAERARYDGYLDYALRHGAVVARYGRFPHRNAALGRADTPDERDYLAQPGAGF
ncbi:DUF924 family protein [Fulvimonas soli]|jgi:uncharacterized protein (DUF924 family)|uniref:Uncharacterized protein (DUF924 family) n=1 Tax=Fulvimonas soli TaxID=155197 RepID=A0A316I0P2_9GAMM|nr:DUF924 family protein [Fulvimonas soli]PWK85905.1 uncharacterized protein (DUF924 family) [Fulvimonas soli]TNY25957.1 hypothetical protein BV497_11200 [Fulvimonas soli]